MVAELENELARRDQALKEGEQAKEKLAEAETARLEAEARLKSTVDTLGGIKDGQDMLSRLMQLAIAGQKSSEDKLATMQDISARILKGQGDIFEGMSILGDLKNRLEMLGLDAQAQQDYAKSFMTWFQNIRGEDVERLQTLDKRSSELLASQKELNDTVFRLRQASSETQKALDEFHTQWKNCISFIIRRRTISRTGFLIRLMINMNRLSRWAAVMLKWYGACCCVITAYTIRKMTRVR